MKKTEGLRKYKCPPRSRSGTTLLSPPGALYLSGSRPTTVQDTVGIELPRLAVQMIDPNEGSQDVTHDCW